MLFSKASWKILLHLWIFVIEMKVSLKHSDIYPSNKYSKLVSVPSQKRIFDYHKRALQNSNGILLYHQSKNVIYLSTTFLLWIYSINHVAFLFEIRPVDRFSFFDWFIHPFRKLIHLSTIFFTNNHCLVNQTCIPVDIYSLSGHNASNCCTTRIHITRKWEIDNAFLH